MQLKIFTLLPIFLIGCSLLNAQDTKWTLQRAVAYALDNNLQVQRLDNATELARLNLEQAQKNRLPTLFGGTGGNLQFGRTIDPTTNAFEQQRIVSQNYGVQGNLTIYNGGLIRNTLRQAEVDLEAAQVDAKVTGNDIALQVANAYLNILLAREQLANARAQLALIDEQLEITEARIRAGSLPEVQRYDLLAQQAGNQRTVIEFENQLALNKLSLQLLLQLDPTEDFDVIVPTIDVSDEQLSRNYNAEEVIFSARQTQPDIRAAELRRTSAEIGKEIARSGLRPSVSLTAGMNTFFSSVAKDFNNPDLSGAELVQGPSVPVIINGEESTISNFQQVGIVFPNLGYFQQLENNFGQSVGVNVSVPIYNQSRNSINVQRAEVQRLGAGLDMELAENQLRNEVEQALASYRAAQQSYAAARVSEDAAERAYEVAQRRLNAGAANSLDLVTAANRLEQARIESTRSKYQLIFNREVIQFYLGEGLSLN